MSTTEDCYKRTCVPPVLILDLMSIQKSSLLESRFYFKTCLMGSFPEVEKPSSASSVISVT